MTRLMQGSFQPSGMPNVGCLCEMNGLNEGWLVSSCSTRCYDGNAAIPGLVLGNADELEQVDMFGSGLQITDQLLHLRTRQNCHVHLQV
jgi:hypothetical protein